MESVSWSQTVGRHSVGRRFGSRKRPKLNQIVVPVYSFQRGNLTDMGGGANGWKLA